MFPRLFDSDQYEPLKEKRGYYAPNSMSTKCPVLGEPGGVIRGHGTACACAHLSLHNTSYSELYAANILQWIWCICIIV